MWIEITRGLRLSTWSVRGAFVSSPSVVFSNILDSADLILCNYDPKKLTFPVRGHRCASHWSRVEALRLWTTQKQWSLVFTSHCPKNWLLPLRGKCVFVVVQNRQMKHWIGFWDCNWSRVFIDKSCFFFLSFVVAQVTYF